MSDLLAAVRKVCLPGLWSQGVELAREGAVVLESRRDDEVVVRVRAKGAAVPPTVALYPDGEEWSCDCGGRVDPCAHVAAAVIALAKGLDADVPKPTGQLVYAFRRHAGTIRLDRLVRDASGTEKPLDGTLATLLARGACPVLPTQADLAVDGLSASFRRSIVPTARIAEVLAALEGTPNVTLDGAPIATRRAELAPFAEVLDGKDGGVLVRIQAPRELDEVVAAGVARAGAHLHPLGATDIAGERFESLPLERRFAPRELGTVATEVLPSLEKRMTVRVRTKRLPRAQRALAPRIVFDLTPREHAVHALTVLPLLVYGDPPVARVEGDALVQLGGEAPLRDPAKEKDLAQRLRDELSLVIGRRADFDGDAAVRFADRLAAFRGDERDELFRGEELSPRVALAGDSFDVTFEVERADGSKATASASDVVRAWSAGLGVAPLLGGGFAKLPRSFLAKHAGAIADLLASKRDDGTIAKSAIPQLARLCDALEAPRPPSFEALRPLVEGDFPAVSPPSDLRAELRTYQEDGLRFLSFLRDAELGAVLADDMGLGKTLQTIAALRGRTLVVCPKSVVFNWEAELAKFRPSLRVSLFHGPKRTLDRTADVVLTTYQTLRMDVAELRDAGWQTVVLDEAQAIKNPDSQGARAAYQLVAPFRVALSGTPIENRLEELFSLFHFTNPGLLGGRSDFRARYEGPIGSGDEAAAARLREKIRPFVLRRLKRDVARDLPPRTDVIESIELDEQERATYDVVRASAQKDVVAELEAGASPLRALEALLRLRQAACARGLLPGQSAPSSSKIDRLVELLGEAAADGHKALVFSQWTSLLDLIEPALREASIGFTRLDGSTRDRGAVVNDFQAVDGPPVLLASLKAGGTGLNLTAADHVFLLDPWWNPAAEEQAADRAHRIGQERPVLVHRLVAKDTVEERVLALAERKRALADAIVGQVARAPAITRDDLLALLS